MMQHQHAWARPSCDMLVKAAVDRRNNFTEVQQASLQEFNARCKGQKIARQQQHAAETAGRGREQTAYERKEAEWRSADISIGNGGGAQGGGIDNWCAKQGNN